MARCFLLIALITLLTKGSFAQSASNDFSSWYWLQLSKDISNDEYVSVQYQSRFDNNTTQFDASNFYVMMGTNRFLNLNMEGLYQYRTSYSKDNHTLYFGATRKWGYKKWNIYVRSAYQHTRDYFSGDTRFDHPIHEWRNRLRVRYKLNKSFNLAFSAEPTWELNDLNNIYIDKIRYMAVAEMNYNKYHSFTLFYFYQPNVFNPSNLKANYVLGMTYQIFLPEKLKKIKNFYKPKIDLDFNNDNGGSSRDQF